MIGKHVLEIAQDYAEVASDPQERSEFFNAVATLEADDKGVVTNFDGVYGKYEQRIRALQKSKPEPDNERKPNDMLGSFMLQYRHTLFPNQMKG